jgi:hypothetical protein
MRSNERGAVIKDLGARLNLPGSALPSGHPGDPNQPWTATEILLIKLTVNRTSSPAYAMIDPYPASGVYTHSTLQGTGYLTNIQQFALDYAAQTQSIRNLTLSPLYPAPAAPHDQMGAADFVVQHRCYVLFVMEESAVWRFMEAPNQVGMTTGNQQSQPYTYSDLNHVIGNSPSPVIGYSPCWMAYFSADSKPGVYSEMPYNLFVDYLPLGAQQPNYQQGYFDPAIKNDGHPPPPLHAKR